MHKFVDNLLSKHKILFFVLVIVGLGIYLPALPVFFSGDDWFHLRLVQIHSLTEFLNFFSFVPNAQSASFYRPLPTQLFFFVFYRLFGLNPIPYHLFALAGFAFSLYLLYKLAKVILKDDMLCGLAVLVYLFSASNFTRLYFLSAFQEIALVVFSLLVILAYIKKSKLTILYLVLALMCKETAIVLPAIFIVYDWSQKKLEYKKYIVPALVCLSYALLRFKLFGVVAGDSYIWNFSPGKFINTSSWYLFWSLGAPEFLVDYIGTGYRPVAKLFVDFPKIWPFIIAPLLLLIIFLLISLGLKIKRINRQVIFSFFIFFITLLPVLFLPQHKFALELGLPMVGFSMFLAWVMGRQKLAHLFFLIFIIYNCYTLFLTYPRHYAVSRGEISSKVVAFLKVNYSVSPQGKFFEFQNDTNLVSKEWGQSLQIAVALSGADFFRVYYNDLQAQAYFVDFPEGTPPDNQLIKISSKQFINQ